MRKTILAAAASAVAAVATAYGPGDAKDGMLRLNAPLQVSAGDAETAAALGRALVVASRSDAGCAGYDIYRSATRPGFFVFCETWKDKASLDAHSAAPHFRGIVPELQKLGTMTVDSFVVGRAVKSGERLRLNCFKTLKKDADAAAFRAKALEMVASTHANDKGVVEYDLLVSVTDPRETMIYETWTGEKPLAEHLASAHLAALAPQLRPFAERSWLEKFGFGE